MMDMSEAKEDETKERKRRVDMAIDMVDKLGEERLGAMFFRDREKVVLVEQMRRVVEFIKKRKFT